MQNFEGSITPAAVSVPEPATLGLFGLGLFGLGLLLIGGVHQRRIGAA